MYDASAHAVLPQTRRHNAWFAPENKERQAILINENQSHLTEFAIKPLVGLFEAPSI